MGRSSPLGAVGLSGFQDLRYGRHQRHCPVCRALTGLRARENVATWQLPDLFFAARSKDAVKSGSSPHWGMEGTGAASFRWVVICLGGACTRAPS